MAVGGALDGALDGCVDGSALFVLIDSHPQGN